MYCADGAASWKEIWHRWTYCETLDYALALRERKMQLHESLDEVKDPLTALLAVMLHRSK